MKDDKLLDGNKTDGPVELVQAPSLSHPLNGENDIGLDDKALLESVRERLANPQRVKVALKDLM